MSRTRMLLMIGAAIPLAACGADDIVSPGTGGNIIINNPPPAPIIRSMRVRDIG
jgi:hypothetical protein